MNLQVCHALLQPAAQPADLTATTSRNLSSLEEGSASPGLHDPAPGACPSVLPQVV